MNDTLSHVKGSIAGLLEKRRKLLLSTFAVVGMYALLGFFLAPWLINKTAVDGVRDSLGAELALGKIAVNPFTLSLRIEQLAQRLPGAVQACLDGCAR